MVEPVVGRDAELEAADRFLEQVSAGPSAFLIEGPPGIGKSTLWRETVARAEARGYRVLITRPAEAEAKLSYSGLADLIGGVEPAAFAALPAPQRTALDVALVRVSGKADRRTLFAGFVSLLTRLAAAGPVLVAVDDLQWLDGPSAAALEFAFRRLANSRVGALATLRSGDAGRARPIERAIGDVAVQRLALGRLSVAALHHVIGNRLGRPLARPTLVRLEIASGGNPFFALEIGRHLIEAGEPAPGEPLPIPDDVDTLVRARIRVLPDRTRAALLTLSALDQPTTEHVSAEALSAAEDADLVKVAADGRISFSHPLYASAVYGAASRERRRTEHRRLANLVRDPEQRARHLALGTTEPDLQVAATLSDAATIARGRGAPDAAAELERLALRLTPDGAPELIGRRLALGSHLFVAGDHAAAEKVLEDVAAIAPRGDISARARLLLAVIAFLKSAFESAIRHAEQAATDAQSMDLSAEAHAALSWMHRDPRRAAEHARSALALLDPGVNPGPYSQSLIDLTWNEIASGHPRDDAAFTLGAAMQTQLDVAGSEGGTAVIFWPLAKDDFVAARDACEAFLERAGRAGREIDQAFGTAMRAEIASWTGEWIGGLDQARRAAEMADSLGSPFVVAFALTTQARLEGHLGRVDDARATLANVRSRDDRWHYAAGVLEFGLGQMLKADGHYQAVTAELEASGIREAVRHRFDGDHLQAVLALGDLDRAHSMVARLDERAETLPRPWTLAIAARCRGLLQASTGDLDGAIASLNRALEHHGRLAMPFELARTLLVKGEVHRRRREKRLARDSIEAARSLFERLGARLWEERASSHLARLAPRHSADGLTATEVDVARLAAAGRTNREVAGALFMSPKTVEKRLASVYAKLGIGSRAELGGRMAEPEGPARARRTAEPGPAAERSAMDAAVKT